MAKKKKLEKLSYSSFDTAGEIADPEGRTIRMTDGSVFKRTVIPSLFSNPKAVTIETLDFDEIDQSSVTDPDADADELA